LGKETVLEGVQADGGLPLRRLGAGALQGVPSISFSLLLARHDFNPSTRPLRRLSDPSWTS